MARSTVRVGSHWLALGLIFAVTSCKSVDTPAATTPAQPAVTTDMRIGWLLRLEQSRSLRDLGLPAAVVDPATPREAQFKPATVPALDALALDPDATLRRRALIAIGRVGMAEGIPALVSGLRDPDPQVRVGAAFGLGLLGTTAVSAAPALESALADSSITVRGRAVEALGLIGDASRSSAIARAAAGCGPLLAPIAPDDQALPKAPEVELCRLALVALARLKQYDALAAVALGPDGQPVSRWWPVAFALQRIEDARAAPALASLASTPGVYTAAFALRGLGALKDPAVLPLATAALQNTTADITLRAAAARALAGLGSSASAPLTAALNTAVPLDLAIELVTAIGTTGDRSAFDAIVDRLTDASPAMRAAALIAAAHLDPDSFLLVASSLGRDDNWSVRAALATALSNFPADRVSAALTELAADQDARVHGPALEALAAVHVPDLSARLFSALEAPDFVERETAARLIGSSKPDGGVERLIAAYGRGESDAAFGARAAALEALAKYGGPDALAAIRRGLSDRAWPVRVRAADLLHELGDASAAPARPAPLRHLPAFFESEALVRPAFSPHAFVDTARGTVEIELHVLDAPITTQTFIELARAGFYTGLPIHRVVPGFVVQAGDPRGDGEGGPGFTIQDELNMTPYVRGTVGMALDWRDTGGSQWFVTLSPQPHLDARYTAFGHVVAGMDVLDRIAPWDTISAIRIWDGVEFK